MAFQPAPGVAQIVASYEQDKQQVANVFHCFIGTGWSEALLNDVAIDLRNAIETNLLPSMSDTVQLIKVQAKDISVIDGKSVEVGPTGAGFGGTASAPPPNNVTLVVKWLTALGGRSHRGRSYIIGLVESVITRNTVNAGFLTSLRTQWTAIMDALNQLPEREFCVLSRFTGGIPRENAICTPIIRLFIDPTVDSQRRRLPGRGR